MVKENQRDESKVNSHLKVSTTTDWVISVLCLSHSVMSGSLQPHGLWPTRLLCPLGFSRQEYWSGLPCPSPEDLPNPRIEPRSPTLQADSLPPEPLGKPSVTSADAHKTLNHDMAETKVVDPKCERGCHWKFPSSLLMVVRSTSPHLSQRLCREGLRKG